MDYFESEIEPLFGSDTEPKYKRKKYEKINKDYSYKIQIIDENTKETVYESVSFGKNKNQAIYNFRKDESEIRTKYLEIGGYVLGITKI
jgi:hypothetical protein